MKKLNLKNKTSVLAIILAGMMIIITSGCKKYPDGPMISFYSRTQRVAHAWKVDNYKMNGNDLTSLYSNYTETYTKDGNYSYSWGMLSGTGKWSFQNKDKEILLSGISNQNTYTLEILKLEEKAFWYSYMDGGNKKEFHMIRD